MILVRSSSLLSLHSTFSQTSHNANDTFDEWFGRRTSQKRLFSDSWNFHISWNGKSFLNQPEYFLPLYVFAIVGKSLQYNPSSQWDEMYQNEPLTKCRVLFLVISHQWRCHYHENSRKNSNDTIDEGWSMEYSFVFW